MGDKALMERLEALHAWRKQCEDFYTEQLGLALTGNAADSGNNGPPPPPPGFARP